MDIKKLKEVTVAPADGKRADEASRQASDNIMRVIEEHSRLGRTARGELAIDQGNPAARHD